MDWSKYYTVLVTIEQNPDGTFKRKDGQKQVKFLEAWNKATKKTNEQINQHFKNPNAALAMVTGKANGLTVIDFDTKDNDLIMELFGAAPTKIIETEKGFHFYYRYCDKFHTVANAFGDGVDCRNDGGLVFCPPTPNYKKGNDEPISPMTEEGIKLLEPLMRKKTVNNLAETTTRNDDLFRKASGWINHYDEKEVWSRMVKANKEFRKGELDDHELETLYQQVIKFKKTGQTPETAGKYKLTTLADISDTTIEQRFSIGFPGLDEVMRDDDLFGTSVQGGVALGEFIALAGRPGNGKTLLAVQLTTALQKSGIKSLWFSYEAKLKKLRKSFERQGADLNMVTSVEISKEAPLLGNINWLEEKIKEAKAQYGIKLVVIDNLDFLETRNDRESNYSMNQQAFLSSIVSELSKISLQFDLILLLIAHVRKPDNTGYKKKRPYMYDIAGTSAVERLCYFGMIIEREEDGDEGHTKHSWLYLDKNREGGVRKKIALGFSEGQLHEDPNHKPEASF